MHHDFKSIFSSLCLIVATASAAEPQRLTHDGRQKSSPVFRDNGREVIFVEFSDPTLFQLRRLVLADGKNELLHADAPAAEFEPTISADGECYACCKLRGVLSVSIIVRDKKGATLSEILPGAGFNGFRSPALAADHSRLAFSYGERGVQQIYVSQLNGEDRKPLTDSRGINNWPAFSPDGRSIAFGSSRDGNFEIYVVNVDGTDLRRLTDNAFQDSRPRFSPDSRRIAFTSHRDGNAEIYVMQADGTAQRRITNSPERDDYPEWHPDGQRLVIVSEQAGMQDLFLIRVPQ